MALLSRFFGRTASEGAAFALGLATGPVLSPAVEEVKNEAWRTHPSKAVEAGDAAEIVAEDVELRDWGASEAGAHGLSGDRFDALVGAVLNAPGMGELLQARRRGLISDARFRHGLRKARLETLWDDAMVGLLNVLLSPSELANARQQGYIDQARQYSEAELQGIGNDRAEIQFLLSGLPPGPETMQEAANRGLADQGEFGQAIREGHTKTKYTDLLWALRHPRLSAAIYVRLYLKGWITKAERDAGGELWGYTPDQMEQWFLSSGRPAAPGQMATAAVRGIDGPDGRPMDEAQFLKGIRQSDIRPEWGPMLWDSRFLYPPLFQLNRLVTQGAIDIDTAETWARKARYAPEVVAALREFWTGGTSTATVDTREKLATTQAVASLKKRFLAELIEGSGVLSGLELLGVAADSAGRILETWTVEKGWTEKLLTPAQIKKGYAENTFTQDEAVNALVTQHHYSPGDAQTFLTL